MRYLILLLLILVIIFLAFAFVFLWQQNQRPLIQEPANREFKVDGLVPFEQWRTN